MVTVGVLSIEVLISFISTCSELPNRLIRIETHTI